MIGRLIIALAMLSIVCACGAPRNMFVLLPEEDGSVGQITVSNEHGQQTLTQPWQATGMNSADQAPQVPQEMAPETVKELFQKSLSAQPLPPMHFLLYCTADSVELTEKSKRQIPEILAAIKWRDSVDTSVIGHADTAGSSVYNLALSKRRAQSVGKLLIAQGVNPDILEISSHGERDLLVPTPDNVSEPLNRRVEVTVR